MDNGARRSDQPRLAQILKRFSRRQYIIAGIAAGTVCLLLLVGLLVFLNKREALLATAISRAQNKLERDYDLNLTIGKAYFSGLNSVKLEAVTVVPQAREPLLGVEQASVSVRILPLIIGQVKLGAVQANTIALSLIKKDSTSNYDFLYRAGDADSVQAVEPSRAGGDMSASANEMLTRALRLIPRDMEIRDLSLTYQDDSTRQHLFVPTADMRNGNLESAVSLNDRDAWQVSGKLYPDRRQLAMKIHANGEPVDVPLLNSKYGLEMSFDTIEVRLNDVVFRDKELQVNGEWSVHDLKINHWRISQQQVVLPHAFIDATIVVGDNYLELSENSEVRVKDLSVQPYFRYTKSPHATYALRLHTPEMDAQDLFDAFPKGLFESLDGIQVSGRIQYELEAFLDSANPDSVQFSAQMREEGFEVESWGETDFTKINSVFTYTPYENDAPVRDIIVGPANPDYVRLHEISPHLRNAVLTTEDPSFFSHNGFVEEAFRSSIAINYKEKAFKRGGSTISMQLVKNIYLNRNKTMVRKVEEIIIVWLLESTRAVSKERMYEVYLNIIEWGLNVYGISEAARYYFGKRPADLTVGESIYLASIVPRPKTGLYGFMYDGRLKPHLSGYFGYIGQIMTRRGLIDDESGSLYGFYAVSLREPLRPPKPEGIDTADIRPPETIRLPETIEDSRTLLRRVFGELGSQN